MADNLQTLTDMGFSRERAARALEVTKNVGVEPAMEWLLAHADEVIPAAGVEQAASATLVLDPTAAAAKDSTAPASDGSSAENTDTDAVAKSFKCNDCDRLFKTQVEIEFHAAKSGHSNFSESTEEKKPLTEEEKREQLLKLEEKLKQKRLEREEKEKQDALEREKNRIKSGKDMSEARRRMEETEMAKILEQRKREKLEEKTARDRVKAQIEADKAARKAKFAAETGQAMSTASSPIAPAPLSAIGNSSSSSSSNNTTSSVKYAKTKIQIRLKDGSAITETFDAKEPLSAVRLYIQLQQNDSTTPFNLMTSFPKKMFIDDDYQTPLEALGLVPSAVLIVTK